MSKVLELYLNFISLHSYSEFHHTSINTGQHIFNFVIQKEMPSQLASNRWALLLEPSQLLMVPLNVAIDHSD